LALLDVYASINLISKYLNQILLSNLILCYFWN